MKIQTEEEYNRALDRLDELIGAPEFGSEAHEYERLAEAIAMYDSPYSSDDEERLHKEKQAQAYRVPTPPEPLFSKIRRLCAWVSESADFVAIDASATETFATQLSTISDLSLVHTAEHHLLGSGSETLGYFIVLDTINFGSGYFPNLKKLPGHSGYFTIARLLREHCLLGGVPNALKLIRFTPEECAAIFRQDLSDPVIAELMGLYARALKELGVYLLRRFDGSFVRMVEAASHNASRLVNILGGMEGFQDVQEYKGRRVPFFKRAQIAVHDLALAFENEGWGRFEDIDLLTVFADNVLADVLRSNGVLVYATDLSNMIDSHTPLPKGSPQEVEIRACTITAVDRMTGILRDKGVAVSDRQLDYAVWNLGHVPPAQTGIRHRTKTNFY
jgi:hypothetical protein